MKNVFTRERLGPIMVKTLLWIAILTGVVVWFLMYTLGFDFFLAVDSHKWAPEFQVAVKKRAEWGMLIATGTTMLVLLSALTLRAYVKAKPFSDAKE